MKHTIVGLGIFVLGTALFGFFILPGFINGLDSLSWPTAKGVILSSEKSEYNDGDSPIRYRTKIRYQYEVGGKRFESENIQIGSDDLSDEPDAEALLSKFPAGSPIIVHHHPEQPEKVVLIKGMPTNFYFVGGMVLFCIGIGLAIVIVPRWRYRAWKKNMANSQQTFPDAPPLESADLTPSEMVLMNGEAFVKRNPQGLLELLDGKTKVSHDWAVAMLEAALLAHEQAGTIKLVVGSNEEVIIEPTGKVVSWPEYSIESCLIIERPKTVMEMFKEWMNTGSNEPWKRVMEQANVLLTLRGFIVPEQSPISDRSYRWRQVPPADVLQRSTEPAVTLLKDISVDRPGFHDKLRTQITKAVKSLVYRGENAHYPDPWLDQSDTVRAPYMQLLGGVKKPNQLGILWILMYSILPWTFSSMLMIEAQYHPAILVGLLLALTGYLLQWRTKAKNRPRKQVMQHLILGVPITILVLSLFSLGINAYPLFTIVVFVGAGFFLARRLLKKRISEVISERVVNREQLPNTTSETTILAKEPKIDSAIRKSAKSNANEEVQADIIPKLEGAVEVVLSVPNTVDSNSPESLSRLHAIDQRGPRSFHTVR